jgi:DNA-binding beta-propeller fold protein YncE
LQNVPRHINKISSLNATKMTDNRKNLSSLSPLASRLNELRGRLHWMIDVDYNLLNTLRNTTVLNDYQIEQIQSKPTMSARVDQLLDFVTSLSRQQQKQFLVALIETQQTHVKKFIDARGRRPSADEQNWPLHDTDDHHRIRVKASELIELIDSVNGLLDEMVASGCITVHHKQMIEARNTSFGKNETLLTIIRRRSVSDFNKFVTSLLKTKQYHVASILKSNADDNNKPLNDKMKKKLLANQAALVKLLDVRHGLLADLVAEDCITRRHKELVENASSQAQSNSLLLDIIMRGSQSDFSKFVRCLINSGQEHVCRILVEDGVVARLVARCSRGNQSNARISLYSRTIRDMSRIINEGSIEQDEACIVEQFRSLLMKHCAERRRELLFKVISFDAGVQLIAIDQVSSIGLYYWCTSLEGLQHLSKLYTSGRLQTLLNKVFSYLLHDSKSLFIDDLSWNRLEFLKCSQYMFECSGMSVFSEVYSLAQRTKNSESSTDDSLFSIGLLPCELTEIVVIRAAALLFTVLIAVNSLADVYVMATLCAVSRLWWRMLTSRKYLKRIIKQNFRRLCQPFKCRSQQLSELCVERNVCGLAEFSEKLYLVCIQSDTITVLNSSPPFDMLDNIIVQEMRDPTDIVVCSDKSRLYVADYKQCAIWRVNLSSYKQVDKFISTQSQPLSLSTKSRRLLITPSEGDALFIYGDNGVLLKHIKLPHYMRATHAVETTQNTHIVSHRRRLYSANQSEHESVSEIDINGRVVRTFNSQHNDIGAIQFNSPQYLVLADNNHVIVADTRNERIVVLNGYFQVKRVFVSSSHGQQPWRLFLSQQTGLLYVAMYRSSYIHVHSILEI